VKASILKLITLTRKTKPNVIFTTMVHCNALAILMKFFFPRIRVVVREATLPSSILEGYSLKGRLCRFVYKFLYPKADLVVSNCSQVLREFKTQVKHRPYKHKVLFNPVDTDKIYNTLPETLEIIKDRQNTVCFTAVGRLSYEKGYDRLIYALKDFNSENANNWRLDIIGEGDYRVALESLIETYHLQDHVFLRGYHSNPWAIAAQADCLVLPSRWEGMPNVVLEGFACGLPAIAIKEAGGISDIAKHAPSEQLQIVEKIDEMVAAMQKVEPSAKQTYAASILPDVFALPEVMKRFENTLTTRA